MFGIGTRSLLSEGSPVTGKITAVSECWWLKVNTKAVRWSYNDGAVYPHIITFSYCVDGVEYIGRRWLSHTVCAPGVGRSIIVCCDPNQPKRFLVDTAQFGVRI